MLCSLQLRNRFIILGVATAHLIMYLLLDLPSFKSERSLSLEFMPVNLVNQSSNSPGQRIFTTPSKPSTVSSAEHRHPSPHEVPVNSVGQESMGYSSGAIPRQTLYNPKPNYPLLSRKLREQGLVMIKLCVNQSGFVDQASISKSSGFQGLDKSALTTLSQWRFLPITSNAQHSSQCFQAPIHFSLEG